MRAISGKVFQDPRLFLVMYYYHCLNLYVEVEFISKYGITDAVYCNQLFI